MQSPVKIWRNQKKIARLIGKTGRVLSWTIIRVPPGDFTNQAPYPVVLVEFQDKERMCAQLVDWEPKQLKFGQKVIAIVRRTIKPDAGGIIPYGIKVKPCLLAGRPL